MEHISHDWLTRNAGVAAGTHLVSRYLDNQWEGTLTTCRNWGTSLRSSCPLHLFRPRSTRCQHARIKRWDKMYEKSTITNFGGLMVLLWVLERRGKNIVLLCPYFFNFPPKVETVTSTSTCLPGYPANLPAWVPYQLACLGALPTCLPGCPTNLPAWVPHQLACLGAGHVDIGVKSRKIALGLKDFTPISALGIKGRFYAKWGVRYLTGC